MPYGKPLCGAGECTSPHCSKCYPARYIVGRILSWLPPLSGDDVAAGILEHIQRDMQRHLDAGWSDKEVFCFFRLLEEFNPGIEEDYALKRMKVVKDRNPPLPPR